MTLERAELILASQSPRRAELLRELGYEFRIVVPPLQEPERLPGDPSPTQLAEALAFFKACSVAEGLDRGIVLGGDTVVTMNGRLFGKPSDRDDARRILTSLAGTTHDVITGVALLDVSTGNRLIQHDRTAVIMKPLSEGEVEAYLDTDAWLGKAGAYGIQDHGDAFVLRIEGSFSNVVGLPVELVTKMLEQWGCPGKYRTDDVAG